MFINQKTERQGWKAVGSVRNSSHKRHNGEPLSSCCGSASIDAIKHEFASCSSDKMKVIDLNLIPFYNFFLPKKQFINFLINFLSPTQFFLLVKEEPVDENEENAIDELEPAMAVFIKQETSCRDDEKHTIPC
ncbi:Protein of unknown function [Gryllus bimaculatus]|nr:Protein of unknown function [Gryllus bimaculatus]